MFIITVHESQKKIRNVVRVPFGVDLFLEACCSRLACFDFGFGFSFLFLGVCFHFCFHFCFGFVVSVLVWFRMGFFCKRKKVSFVGKVNCISQLFSHFSLMY